LDEGREPRGVSGRRAQVPHEVPDDGGAARGCDRPRLEPPARARRRVIRARQARVHRQEVLSVHGVADGRRARERVRGDDAGRRARAGRLAVEVGEGRVMARIIAGVGTSHTPAIGAAVDNGRTAEPYWAPLFKGYEPSKKWMAETAPDVAIVVYN